MMSILTFYSPKNPEISYSFHKNININIFNLFYTAKNKCFLYIRHTLDTVMLKTGVMTAKNSALSS